MNYTRKQTTTEYPCNEGWIRLDRFLKFCMTDLYKYTNINKILELKLGFVWRYVVIPIFFLVTNRSINKVTMILWNSMKISQSPSNHQYYFISGCYYIPRPIHVIMYLPMQFLDFLILYMSSMMAAKCNISAMNLKIFIFFI